MKAALQRLKATRAYRAYQCYTTARGGLLAGGIAYFAFFSLFPALTLGFAIFGFVLRGHPDLYRSVVNSVSTTFPGVVKDAAHPDGIIDPSRLPTPSALTITGLIALVILLLSGLGWLGAMREGIRAMFGRPRSRENAVKKKLRDIGVLALLGLSMLVSAILSAAVNGTTGRVLELIGVSSSSTAGRVILPIVGFLVVLVVDIGIFVVLLRLLSSVPISWVDLRQAAVVGALAIGVLKVAVSYGVVGSSTNPLLASFAIILGLLIVLNLMSRVTLIAAAWAAIGSGLVPAGTAAESAAIPATSATPARAPLPVGSHLRTPHPVELEPNFGARSADRTAIAAGAVLGATAAVGVAAVRRATGTLVAMARRR